MTQLLPALDVIGEAGALRLQPVNRLGTAIRPGRHAISHNVAGPPHCRVLNPHRKPSRARLDPHRSLIQREGIHVGGRVSGQHPPDLAHGHRPQPHMRIPGPRGIETADNELHLAHAGLR